MKCWYQGVCNQECSESCIRYLEMTSMMEQSGLPQSRWFPDTLSPDECDYDAFCRIADIKDDVENYVENAKNLYLYSDRTGNGKTSWAIKLLLRYFDRVWAGNGFKCRGVFVHVPTFLSESKNFEAMKPEIVRLKEILPNVDVVVWDDIASTHLSNYDHSQLITFIDQRTLNQKSNIYTGNLKQAGIEKALGARLASRVWNASERIELRGRDKR